MSRFIPKPREFTEVTRLPPDVKKAWLKANLKDIKQIINDKKFIMDYPDKGEPVTPFMYVYKEKIKSDGSIDELKLIILVRRDLNNKKMIGDTWSPTASTRTMKYL